MMSRTLPTGLSLLGSLALIVGCDASPTAPSRSMTVPVPEATAPAHGDHQVHASASASAGNADVQQGIAAVRRFLAPFHNFDKAVEFGYSVAAPGPGVCISDPVRGGMGYHYTRADRDLVGDGVVNLLEPEFLVYSPTKNGKVKLSAVDYFVPFETWPHAEPPELLGVPFVAEEAFGAWVLHIWAFWHNPVSIFSNYNPDVPLCP